MEQRHRLAWGWVVILALPVLLAGPLLAAEGTARLVFQKKTLAKLASRNQRQTYIVKRGDTLARIIRKIGGKPPKYEEIKRLNPHIPNLNRIYPGQQLVLTPPGTQLGSEDNTARNMVYRVQKGDSLTGIIVSVLGARPPGTAKIFRSIKHLNPAVTDLNKIFTGQILKLPVSKGGDIAGETPLPAADNIPESDGYSMLKISEQTESRLRLLEQIIKELNGTLLTSGNYYIPLSAAGQLTLDCGTIPVAELDDGTTVILDIAGRLPDELAKIIRTRWRNYHLVKFPADADVVSVLREIIMPSTYRMEKMAEPLSLGYDSRIKLYPDWLITRKESAGSKPRQWGLFFVADKPGLLPPRLVSYAQKEGVIICEILGDKLQGKPAEPAPLPPLRDLRAGSTGEELANILNSLGFDPSPGKEIKIFDTHEDGFDLSVRAEYLIKIANKTVIILKNELPRQFADILKKEGMEPFYLTPAPKKNLLEGLLTALDIPHQFALYALPAEAEKSAFRLFFPALKMQGAKETSYLIDFDMNHEVYELLADYGRLKIVRY